MKTINVVIGVSWIILGVLIASGVLPVPSKLIVGIVYVVGGIGFLNEFRRKED